MRVAALAVVAGAAAWAPRPAPRVSLRCAATTHGDKVVVALTREAGKNGGLACALAEHQIDTVEVPCVSTQRTPRMDALLDGALLFAEDPWDWVVVTSPEAAKTFGAAVARAGLGATRDAKWRSFRLAAVGGATAAALDACQDLRPWRGNSFTPATATAAALAKALPDDAGRRVLFPASALAAPTLEDGLTERHFDVTRVDAYTTAPAPWSSEDAAAAASATVVAVGSPSAARVWAARASVNVRAACVGATSAEACVDLGFARDRVFAPAKPGLAGWAGAVRDAAAALA